MPRRRDPALLSQYTCRFCREQIVWGELLRLLRTDPGQAAWMQKESYAHHACLRAALRPHVPLAFVRHWNGKHPIPDDRADMAGQPCGLCGGAVAEPERTVLRVQRLNGPVKAPEFDEESVALHGTCLGGIA